MGGAGGSARGDKNGTIGNLKRKRAAQETKGAQERGARGTKGLKMQHAIQFKDEWGARGWRKRQISI